MVALRFKFDVRQTWPNHSSRPESAAAADPVR